MRVRAFDNRLEFLEQILPLLRVHPISEIGKGIVANDIHPLIVQAAMRLEKLSCEIARIMRLRGDRPASPCEVVLYFFFGYAMGKDHRHGRLGAVVAGENEQA